MDLNIKKGEFICIIGAVGSGKSSLLSAITGDMIACHHNDVDQDNNIINDTKPKHKRSPIVVNQSLSYVQQSPWIQNKTIRENIVFGKEFDIEHYKRVVKICELKRDL